jgi:hypothetical protein
MTIGIDRRTRHDGDARTVSADEFWDATFPALADEYGELAAAGVHRLGARPLTLDTGDRVVTVHALADRLTARNGSDADAVTVQLSAAQFSDFAQQLRTFSALTVAREIRPEGGTVDDLSAWDAVWLALLEGWPVVPEELTFTDREGAPLDLTRAFTPDDAPEDIAHFLREAGYLHLRGWTDKAAMQAIAADIDQALTYYSDGDGRSWWATLNNGQRQCVRLQHFVQYSPATAGLLGGERWDQLRRALAGTDELVQAPIEGNCIEALIKPLGVAEGISDVPWHRDCNFGRHAYQCSGLIVGVSVTPGSPESGLLRAVAGSHRYAMPATLLDGRNESPALPDARSYLPVVPLATQTGDLTVHLSCTLHEAQPPRTLPRKVMYTGFGLPKPADAVPTASQAIADLREKAQFLQSQPPSPVRAVS